MSPGHLITLMMCLVCAVFTPLAAAAIPAFKDCQTRVSPPAHNAPVQLRTADDHLFRTRLKITASQPPNFAGHYSLGLWGCGTECVMGAAVDTRTGRVIWLPGTVSGWSIGGRDEADYGVANPNDFDTVQFKADSCLIVLNGSINEQGDPARHYYQLRGGRFVAVRTIAVPAHPERDDQ